MEYQCRDQTELSRVTTPLLHGRLKRVDRQAFESELPDAMRDPRRIKVRRLPHFFKNLRETYPHPPEYYFPSVSDEFPSMSGYLTDEVRSLGTYAGPTAVEMFQEPSGLEGRQSHEPPPPDSYVVPRSESNADYE